MLAVNNGERPLTIALAKGRMLQPAWQVLHGAGLVQGEAPKNLLLAEPTVPGGPRVLIVRSSDVLTYVAAGVAQLGFTGKDMLLERNPGAAVQELADLSIGRCRISVAAPEETAAGILEPGNRRLRIATGLPNLAKDHFQRLGRTVDVIRLHGAVEVAPALGLADAVVDIVETGGTLRRHGLVEIAQVTPVTTRLVGNAAALRAISSGALWPLVDKLREAGRRVAGDDGADKASATGGGASAS